MNEHLPTPAAGAPAQRRIPRATYRLQFNPNFTFADAQAQIAYLHALGISDCYASPIFQSASGSMHGYDICDHSQLRDVLGGEADFDAFAAALRASGMGLILDIVPNHMGIGDSCNPWWSDVLENGPGSTYASYFDIDWQPVRPELENKVLLPLLEDQYGTVLEAGKLRLAYEDGAFTIFYYATRLPVAPRTYRYILRHTLEWLEQQLDGEHAYVQELQSILTAIHYLPPRLALPPDKRAERNREKEIIKRRLAALVTNAPAVQTALHATLRAFNGDTSDPTSFDLLDKLLEEQAYRPAYWRVAAEEINYRRFFDINELAAIRVEHPEVFQATHALTLRLLADGKATGLRIDHPDGLWDPPRYFRQLQESYAKLVASRRDASWQHSQAADCMTPEQHPYVVAEKILASGETLPHSWVVDGTTGYDFLNAVNGLFVQRENAAVFQTTYSHFIGDATSIGQLTNSAKKMIMLVSLASEINELSQQLERIAECNRRYRDFTLGSLTFAIREVIACLPIYRTYMTGPESVTPRDRTAIEAAVAEAKKRNPRTAEAIFDFLLDTLLFRNVERFAAEDRAHLTDFVMKFQQLSGPVMAKGVEDTVFYRYNRLVSLNEVGGHPEHFGTTLADFHEQNAARQQHWPHAMLASSTHDTKRSEDVRARINVLSELPAAWLAGLARWAECNAGKKTPVDGELAPDANDEYLLYQTLLGVWPFELLGEAGATPPPGELIERVAAYMLKATKEAKVHTSWVNPNTAYDSAMRDFVYAVLAETGTSPFWELMLPLLRQVAFYGQFNALSQVLLKLTSPGVPDIYQGNELWDFSLVDPDNRRPVDYAQRRVLLMHLKERIAHAGSDRVSLAQEVLRNSHDGRIKLYLTERALDLRRAQPDLFAFGSYVPLEAQGARRGHVCAFARQYGSAVALTVAPRWFASLCGGQLEPPLGAAAWGNTRLALPAEQVGWRYEHVLTGEILRVSWQDGQAGLPLAALCRNFPVALLTRLEE